MIETFRRGEFLVSTERRRLDAKAIQAYLRASYWASTRPLWRTVASLNGSHCFGLYRGKEQVGFARVITDYATFGYLADVYVRPDLQGKGLGVWLVACVMKSKALKTVRSFALVTKDAMGLYRKFGFGYLPKSRRVMWKKR